MSDKKSVKLSYLLRHSHELTIDNQGWATIDSVLSRGFSLDEINTIVEEDSKDRYSIDGGKIRANQGHSLSHVKIAFEKAVPPPMLFHGTTEKVIDQIRKQGLLPMDRHHVHLSADEETAKAVGARRKGQTFMIKIAANKMLADGITFLRSDNGVWLVDKVTPKYFASIDPIGKQK